MASSSTIIIIMKKIRFISLIGIMQKKTLQKQSKFIKNLTKFLNLRIFYCFFYNILGPGTGSGAASWNSWNMPQNNQSTGPSGRYIKDKLTMIDLP